MGEFYITNWLSQNAFTDFIVSVANLWLQLMNDYSTDYWVISLLMLTSNTKVK